MKTKLTILLVIAIAIAAFAFYLYIGKDIMRNESTQKNSQMETGQEDVAVNPEQTTAKTEKTTTKSTGTTEHIMTGISTARSISCRKEERSFRNISETG